MKLGDIRGLSRIVKKYGVLSTKEAHKIVGKGNVNKQFIFWFHFLHTCMVLYYWKFKLLLPYQPLCPSVCGSVGWFVCWLVYHNFPKGIIAVTNNTGAVNMLAFLPLLLMLLLLM